MIRHEEPVLRKLETFCSGEDVLEIGCGDGSRLPDVVRTSSSWLGIDPDSDVVRVANETNESPHAEYEVGHAEDLRFGNDRFDVVLFTLSLHHIEIADMANAIDEAVRVVRPTGCVLFLEPLPVGTFYDAEMRFGCCDGDERRELAYAFYSMLSSQKLHETEEFVAPVCFEYDSIEDFVRHVPTQEGTHGQLEEFLSARGFKLDERWRLNVFSVSD